MQFLRLPLPGALLAAALALLASSAPAVAQPTHADTTVNTGAGAPSGPSSPRFFGPLTTEEAAPLQRVSYTHSVEGADVVERGRVQAEVWVGYGNIFEQDSAATHDLFLDLERLTTATGVRFGVHDRLEVGGRLTFVTTGGGILDDFISGWHTSLGLANGDREKYPSGAYEQRLRDGRGQVRLEVPQATFALEDARLFVKWLAWRSGDGGKALSLRGVARVPARENLVGPQRTDVALMALVRTSDAPWYFHGTLGAATVRAARDFDGILRDGSFFMDMAVERNFAPRVSGVVQLSVASPRLQGFDDPELDGWPVNLVFGAIGEIGDGWRVDVSFQEDVPANTPAVDFTLGIGVRKAW